MSANRTCEGMNASGDPCGAPPELVDPETGYCPAHAPEGSERMKQIAARGGKAAAAQGRDSLHPDDLAELETFEDAKRRLDLISRSVLTGQIREKTANAAIRAVREWVRAEGERAAAEDLEALRDELERVKEEMDAAHEPWRGSA